MRPAIRFATTAAHVLRQVLPNDAGLAAGAASAGDPGPLLERRAHRPPTS
jgi:hypothetical protein